MFKTFFKIFGILFLGAAGAAIFEFFVFPYLPSYPKGEITVNRTEQVFIQENTALENAVKKVQKSIIRVEKNGIITGFGFVATSDGSVVALASLIPLKSNVSILLNGEPVSYKVEKVDLKNNLVLLKINKNNLQTAGFADFSKLAIGQRVFLSGTDFANEGIIRSFNNSAIKTNISESAAIGAPLFTITGELAGISYIGKDGKINAVPITIIKSFLGI